MPNSCKLTLCIIVKNEAHIVTNLLDSVRHVVDNYVVVDTGSTDDTVRVLREYSASCDQAFAVYSRPWRNFGHNRSEALALARTKNPDGYTLMLDADEQLITPDGAVFDPADAADVYTLTINLGGTVYRRRMLFSNRKPWAYTGVIHEVATCDGEVKQAHYTPWVVHSVHAGARSRDPNTYKRDAAALQAALIDEPDNSRYVFYLAQSHYDSQDWLLAARYYTQRTQMGGWADEVWFSHYRLGLIAYREAGKLTPAAVAKLLHAYSLDRSRAEPMHVLGMLYKEMPVWPLAHLFLKQAYDVTVRAEATGALSGNRLFIDADLYAWRAAMEYAVACFYAGDYGAAVEVNDTILQRDSLPEHIRTQVTKNQKFCTARV
ncbi:MAG: glycosyltransferase [Cytophagaceae bacterium]|nr:MAG: glycosyltransferase [Cytophagaceae bacterium]